MKMTQRLYLYTGGALAIAAMASSMALQGCARHPASAESSVTEGLLNSGYSITEDAKLAFAPNVPPPIERSQPAIVRVHLTTEEATGTLMEGVNQPTQYRFWTFNGHVPGPMIRARVGDMLEIRLTNNASSIMPHNIDLHAVTGPGGGAEITITQPGQTSAAQFKLLNPGLYVYHCAVPPVPTHIANGMYGLILVEPEEGLPPVDREYYVMQSEFYTSGEFGAERLQAFSPDKLRLEQPTYIVFNGRVGSLMDENALTANVGDKIRLFVGNGGPAKISSFHVIGAIFDRVYPEGSMINPEGQVQTTLVPPGGSTIVEWTARTAGTYTLVDHAINRLEIGAVGMLKVSGRQDWRIYNRAAY